MRVSTFNRITINHVAAIYLGFISEGRLNLLENGNAHFVGPLAINYFFPHNVAQWFSKIAIRAFCYCQLPLRNSKNYSLVF